MTIVKETPYIKAYDLKGRVMFVKTIWEKDKNGQTFSRRVAIREKRVA